MNKPRLIVLLLATAALHSREVRADPAPQGDPAPPSSHETSSSDAASTSAKAPFREPGRFGIQGAVTSDGFQFGFARLGENYELNLTADGAYSVFPNNKTGGDMGITVRAGPRFSLGHLNYLGIGVLGHVSLFGRDDGVSTAGTFSVGPYVGLQRHFAGTPLVINLWVMPYQYARTVGNDGSGGSMAVVDHQFFQGGGFGLTYLFGGS